MVRFACPRVTIILLVVNAVRHLLMVPPTSKMNAHSLSSRPLVPVLQNGLFPIFYRDVALNFLLDVLIKIASKKCKKMKKNFQPIRDDSCDLLLTTFCCVRTHALYGIDEQYHQDHIYGVMTCKGRISTNLP